MKRNKKRDKPTRTLSDIRCIPKWARKVGFTCEEVEFDYKLITHFFNKNSDTKQTRPSVFAPGIGQFAVTPWVEG